MGLGLRKTQDRPVLGDSVDLGLTDQMQEVHADSLIQPCWSDWAGATGGPSGRPGCEEKVRRKVSVGRGGGVLSHAGT